MHFGHYGPGGEAIDPMGSLVSWLHEAESDLGELRGGASTTISATTATATPPSWSTPAETLPLLVSLEEEDANVPRPIAASPVGHAFVAAEGRDGAVALTLIWVAAISFAVASRRLGRLVVARRKRTS